MAAVVDEELDLLAQVTELLAQLPERDTRAEAPLVRELEQLREQIIAGRDSKDAFALHDQWHRQSALLRQLRASRQAPEVDPRSPYFAHMQLRENGRVRDLCLGRATCIEGGLRIVDWRNAPVSRLFYRYGQGEEYEEDIAGHRRVGEVLVRRTVVIRDAALERVDAPEGIFTRDAANPGGWQRSERRVPRLAGGEGSALRAHPVGAPAQGRLGSALDGGLEAPRSGADKRLREITGLIDPEQFSLIARPAAGFLVVRGAAGSGKTTVALHRIAYLAYQEPEIDSPRSQVIVFSPGLRRYVAHVLPSLGVERVSIATFQEWAAEQRRRHFPTLPRERRSDGRELMQRVKLHPGLERALAAQVERVAGPASAEQALDDWASALSDPKLLAETFAAEAPGAFRPADLERFAEWSRQRSQELFQWLAGDAEQEVALEPEDDALLLRCWQLRVGPLRQGTRPLRYRHVAIDEVQDFSVLEVRVLLDCLDPRRSVTLAGDTQQHLAEGSGFTSWAEFLERLGVEGSEMETLRVSYRSTQEIVEFALSVLGPLREPEERPTATRSGPPVELFRFTDRGACVAFLADALCRLAEAEPEASVAVLAPTPELAEIYTEGLAAGEVPRLRRVAEQDFRFAPGVEVTEIEQVKGLEFDYVIVLDATAEHFPDAATGRRRLHVGATRAVHQLWLTCIGTPSPLLVEAGAQAS